MNHRRQKNRNVWMIKLKKKLTTEKVRIRLQFLCVYAMFSITAFLMTLVNALTGWYTLMLITLAFGLLNVANLLMSLKPARKAESVARILFGAEILGLFVSFIILGDPDGFSAIWIALLPAAGLLLYRKKNGTILSGIMLLILIFFFWTPIGRACLQYEYTETFMFRFPILYVVFYSIGLIFEVIRSITQAELNLSKDKYFKLSYTDRLTGLGNESQYLLKVEELENAISREEAKFAVIFLDVNGVKATNDQFGHRFGCHLIVTTGKILPTIFKTSNLFHIGGDEFVVIASGDDYDHLETRISALDDMLQHQKINYEGTELTLSVARGYAKYQPGDKYSGVVQRADEAMYRNKFEIKVKYNIAIR